MISENDVKNESGKGTKYQNVARSAYGHALTNPLTKTLLLVPEAAFLYSNRKLVDTLAALSPDQVRDVIVHHSLPIVQESELDSLSTLFQLAHHCHEEGILIDLASMHLSIKSDKYWVHASVVTRQVNEILRLKKENHVLARRLKKAIDAYRRRVEVAGSGAVATKSADDEVVEVEEVAEEKDVSLASLLEEKKPEEKAYDPLDACVIDVSDPEMN